MESKNGKIIVEVDYSQKRESIVGGTKMLLAKQYSKNRRESESNICKVVCGNRFVKSGTILIVHHGRFSENSPHHLGNNQYAIPYNRSIFAKIKEDGTIRQMCGNIIVSRIYDESSMLVPEHLKKTNSYKFKVVDNGHGYKNGQYIFCSKFSDYEIVCVFNGQEHRVIKVHKDDIIGVLSQ